MTKKNIKKSLVLSIITICYNQLDIEDTCESIVRQRFQNFEWIVIDGGSTDGTLEKLQKYKKYMTHFISEKDNGIYNAMNKGIKLAKGEYLNFMNGGDSFFNDDVLARVFSSKKYNADILYGNCNIIFNNSIPKLFNYPKVLNKYYFINHCISHQSSFIKKECFIKYGLYKENYKIVSDWAKWICFIINRCSFQKIEETIANHKANGISHTNMGLAKQESAIELLEYFTKHEIKKYLRPYKKIKIYLFGIILIFQIKFWDEKTIFYFLSFIPLLTIKNLYFKYKLNLLNFFPIIKIKIIQ